MTFGGPLDLLITAVLAVRRFGLGRTCLASILLTPAYLWSLPPTTCSCFGPRFRRCSRDRMYLAAVKSDLKNLAPHQEIYWADYGVFSSDVQVLGFYPSRGVDIAIYTSQNGRAARATHEELEAGEGCALFVGDGTPGAVGPSGHVASGELVCGV